MCCTVRRLVCCSEADVSVAKGCESGVTCCRNYLDNAAMRDKQEDAVLVSLGKGVRMVLQCYQRT